MNMMVLSMSLKTIEHGVDMEDYFEEMRLSRAFACEFDAYFNWCRAQNVHLPDELRDAYLKLKNHYDIEMSKELS